MDHGIILCTTPKTLWSSKAQSNACRMFGDLDASAPSDAVSSGINALLLSTGSSAEVVLPLGIFILANQVHHNFSGCVELAQSVSEGLLVLVGFEESIALAQPIVLQHDTLEERRNARVVREHESADTWGVWSGCVR